jgi:hypothetical protein
LLFWNPPPFEISESATSNQGLVIRNLAQTLDIIEHSKSGLGTKQYDLCYRLKPGSNKKKRLLLENETSIYKYSGFRHVVNFVLMADCRNCCHLTGRHSRLIFGSLL